MQNIVNIKGREDGLEIFLDEKETYPVLREELLRRLKSSKDFFVGSKTKVIIRGKHILDAQRRELKRVFAMDFGIRDVLFGDEADMLREVELAFQAPVPPPEEKEEKKPKEAKKDQGNGEAGKKKDDFAADPELVSNSYFDAQSIFIKNTVRSGQRVECEGDIVVVGDVNPGAEIIAGGSIAVFGRLRGLAHGGCRGRTDVCIAAVDMCPKQLRLSGRIVTFPDDREPADYAEVAELIDGKVVIRPANYR